MHLLLLLRSLSISMLHKVVEIAIPELLEMHTAHIVAMGTDMIRSLDPYWEDSGLFILMPPKTILHSLVWTPKKNSSISVTYQAICN